MIYPPGHRFNTNNPLGSNSPFDLYDNAGILDHYVNDLEEEFWEDRFGQERLTWGGMELQFEQAQNGRDQTFQQSELLRETEFTASQQDKEDRFQQFLADSGYIDLGDYDADGPLTITARNEIFSKDREYYRIKPGVALPYTTTGVWATDQDDFVAIGDAALRQELASEGGVFRVKDAVANVPTFGQARGLEGLSDGDFLYLSPGDGLDGFFEVETSGASDDGRNVLVTIDGKRLVRRKVSSGNGQVALQIPGSPSKTHLLIRSVNSDNGTRLHVEPKGHVDDGTAAKQDWMFDPYDEDQVSYRIVNIFTKNGVGAGFNGQNGVAVFGAKGVGDHFGIFPSINVGFSDDNANGVPLKIMYFDTSDTEWHTPLLGAWREGRAVSAGDYILANFRLYQADGAGTTGATKPSHSGGSVSDGGVSWTFVRDYQANAGGFKPCLLIGDRDDMPKFGFPNARAQFAGSAVIWNGEKFQFLDNSGNAVWEIGVDLNTDDFHIRSLTGGGSLRFDAAGSFVQNTGLSYLALPKVEDSGATSVNVDGTELLAFANGSATDVDSFVGKGYQRFWVSSGNGQTTLIHGPNIRLINGVNRTLDQDSVLAFVMDATGTVARQVVQ